MYTPYLFLTAAKRNLKSLWEEWTERFMTILIKIFIPAHKIMNSIAPQFNLINSQLNPVSYLIIKTLVDASHDEYATIRFSQLDAPFLPFYGMTSEFISQGGDKLVGE